MSQPPATRLREPNDRKRRRSSKKQSSAQPLDRWDWSDSTAVRIELTRAFGKLAAEGDGTPYWGRQAIARRIVYRAGCYALDKQPVEQFFGDLRDKRQTGGRHSEDIFVVLQRMIAANRQIDGFSNPQIKKHAGVMRILYGWDIYWRYYNLMTAGVGVRELSKLKRCATERPRWADGLTNAAHRAVRLNEASTDKQIGATMNL